MTMKKAIRMCRLSARSDLRSFPLMPHEDIVSQKQGKRRREAPFKCHRAGTPFDADPDNYHYLSGYLRCGIGKRSRNKSGMLHVRVARGITLILDNTSVADWIQR